MVWLWGALALFPVVAIVAAAQQGEAAWQLRLGDTDNYMRLVQVRDWLQGQSWWDVTQHRVNPPDGLRMHWSRLADLPYALPISLLSLFLSVETAERLTVVAIPPLLLLATMMAVSRLCDEIAGWRAAVCACLLLAVSPVIIAQYVPGRLDHHGLQMVLMVSAIACAAGRDTLASGLGAAFFAALSLAVGLETAPYLAATTAWVGGRWVLRGGEARDKAIGVSAGLALFVPLVAVLTIPASEWAIAYSDALGRGHVLAASLGGSAFAAALLATGGHTLAARLAQAGAGAAGLLAAILVFPEILRTPYSALDPLLERVWLNNLAETRSFLDLWHGGPLLAIGRVIFLGLATLSAFLLIARSKGGERDRHLLLGLLVLTAWPLFLWQIRAAAPATLVAIPSAAILLARAWKHWIRGGSVLPLAAAVLMLNPIVPVALFTALHGVASGRGATPAAATAAALARTCDRPSDFRALARLERGLILNPIDQSPAILARTPHSVITTSIHRNDGANRRAYLALAAPSAAAERRVRETGADYLVFCPSAAEVRNFVGLAPRGLLASLRAGRTPPWLEEVPEASRGNLRVFAVRR